MTTDVTVEELESRERIRILIANYCHGIDGRDLERFEAIWHPDAEMLNGEPIGDFRGIEEIRRGLVEVIWPQLPETHHWTTNTVLDFADPDHASGLSDVNVAAVGADGTRLSIGASYKDDFERREDEWRFARRHCTIHFQVPVGAA